MNGLHVACTGRLGGEPDLAYTAGGKARLTFSIAVDEHTSATEERPAAETQWLRVTCWEATAETLGEQLRKGSAVYVEGRLRLDRWQDKATGEARSGLSVSAWRCEPHGQLGKQAPRRERQPLGAPS